MNFELALILIALLSAFIGYTAGWHWRGSEWRKRRKARREAIHKAARNYGRGYHG